MSTSPISVGSRSNIYMPLSNMVARPPWCDPGVWWLIATWQMIPLFPNLFNFLPAFSDLFPTFVHLFNKFVNLSQASGLWGHGPQFWLSDCPHWITIPSDMSSLISTRAWPPIQVSGWSGFVQSFWLRAPFGQLPPPPRRQLLLHCLKPTRTSHWLHPARRSSQTRSQLKLQDLNQLR